MDLRKEYVELRKAVTASEPEKVAALSEGLMTWLIQQKPKCIGFYLPFRGEPDITNVLLLAREKNIVKTLAVPIIDSSEQSLMHYGSWDSSALMTKNIYGIVEPKNSDVVTPDVILSPCVAINSRGFRLGNGKGYFDRYLAFRRKTQTMPETVAIAYEVLITNKFKENSYDVPFGWVATELGVRRL